MNRNQRKFVPKAKQNVVLLKSKQNMRDDAEEILPSKSQRNPFIANRAMTNRCCYVSPVCKDVELSTDDSGVYVDDHVMIYIFSSCIYFPFIMKVLITLAYTLGLC